LLSLPFSPWPFAPLSGCEGLPMFDLILGLTVAAGLFAYLCAALLRPDRF
jgi:K+-transporting ATPase KdpF subunit